MSAISNDPLTKFTIELAKQVSRFRTKDLVENLDDDEDIYSDGQDVESKVSFRTDLYFTKSFPLNVEYTSPTEPDMNLDKCWIRGNNLGVQMNDISTFENHANIFGEPILVSGNPFDLGIHTGTVKSIATRFNRPASPFTNEEYMAIPDHSSLQVIGLSTGFSIFTRFRLHSIAQQGGLDRTIWEKIDDSTPNNAIMLKASTTGRLTFVVKRGGSEFRKRTPTSSIAVGTVYEVWVNYAVSGDAIKIYINNVDQTLTDDPDPAGYHSTLSNHDLNIFRRGAGTSGGYTYGDFYDFLYKREKVVSATEVSRHYTNKWTTANIPFGQVAVSNYTASITQATDSFTSTSFTSTSFTQ